LRPGPNPRADPAAGFNEALADQNLDGVANDRAADPVALGERAFIFDQIAGLIETGNDAPPEFPNDLRREARCQRLTMLEVIECHLIHMFKLNI